MDVNKTPNPKTHLYISFAKSSLRVIAGAAFICGWWIAGGSLLIAAELLGIAEELF